MTQHKPALRRSPVSPFQTKADVKYPRAGVRQTPDGRWMLSLWNAGQALEVIDEPVFGDRKQAFDYGYLTIGACRKSGVDLNGHPV